MPKIQGTKPTVPPVRKRPCCHGCGKKLPITYGVTLEWGSFEEAYNGNWWYNSYGHFCTQRCATKWANAFLTGLGKERPKNYIDTL